MVPTRCARSSRIECKSPFSANVCENSKLSNRTQAINIDMSAMTLNYSTAFLCPLSEATLNYSHFDYLHKNNKVPIVLTILFAMRCGHRRVAMGVSFFTAPICAIVHNNAEQNHHRTLLMTLNYHLKHLVCNDAKLLISLATRLLCFEVRSNGSATIIIYSVARM